MENRLHTQTKNKLHLPSRLVTVEDHDQNPPEKIIKSKINKRQMTLYIGTYNVRTLSTYPRLLELTECLKNIKFDIIGFSEIRKLGNTIEEHEEFIFYYIGVTPGQYGVGFIVKKYLKKHILSFTGLSERVALLKMNINGLDVSIIQVYAPTETSSDEELELFYSTVDKAIHLSANNVIVMGDFNAKVGKTNPNETTTGNYGYGERNCRGNRLIDFARENNFAIMNTFFKKNNKQRWTWRSPNGKAKNEIDYILTNLHRNIYNIQVLNITYPSDHRPLRAALNILPRKRSRCKFGQCPIYQLNNEEETQTYKQMLNSYLTNMLENWGDEVAAQNHYDDIINAIDTSLKKAHELPSNTNPGKNEALSARTKALIYRRQELQKTKPKSRTMKNELKALYKLISKRINLDYKAHRTRTIEKQNILLLEIVSKKRTRN